MNIGFVGLGKLGLPIATAMTMKGHNVIGYDIDPDRMSKDPQEYKEAGPFGVDDFNKFLALSKNLSFGSLQEVANHSEIIFVAVQTPHKPEYEGVTPLPKERADFNYDYLRQSIIDLEQCINNDTIVAVISTVLPGTMETYIKPLLNDRMKLVYNPYFIAMGTAMQDFLQPEFVLIGQENEWAASKLAEFYDTITSAPVQFMSIESAELCKVLYNTYISTKIAYVNTIMELCEKIPKADVDNITDTLKLAHRRLISTAYLTAGGGDGGACHCRDNIAMSWLAKQLNLSYDLFNTTMECRQSQSNWLAHILYSFCIDNGLPAIILGYAFKPETNITVGSFAVLVKNLLKDWYDFPCILMDNNVKEDSESLTKGVYLIGCKHPEYADYRFPKGSIVIDPFRYIEDQGGVEIHRLGESK